MTGDRLRGLQRRWLQENGWDEVVPDALDLTRLPQNGSWDVWALGQPPTLPEDDLETALAQVEQYRTEVDLRKNLVAHARALLRLEEAWQREREAADDLEALPEKLRQEAEQNRSWLRASSAARAVVNLPPAVRRRAALLTVRCPSGCNLLEIVGRVHRGPESFREDLLAVGRTERRDLVFAWVTSKGEATAFPEAVTVTCGHGNGKLPTDIADLADRQRRRTMLIPAVHGASWIERH